MQDRGDDAPDSARAGNAKGNTRKRPYEPPRIEKRIPIAANTLVSGAECVFDPGPCPP